MNKSLKEEDSPNLEEIMEKVFLNNSNVRLVSKNPNEIIRKSIVPKMLMNIIKDIDVTYYTEEKEIVACIEIVSDEYPNPERSLVKFNEIRKILDGLDEIFVNDAPIFDYAPKLVLCTLDKYYNVAKKKLEDFINSPHSKLKLPFSHYQVFLKFLHLLVTAVFHTFEYDEFPH